MEHELETEEASLLQLDERHAAKKEVEEDFVEVDFDDGSQAELEATTKLLRDTAVLLEFLGNPDYCKSMTKTLRALADKTAERLYEQADKVEALAAGAEEDDEEDDDF